MLGDQTIGKDGPSARECSLAKSELPLFLELLDVMFTFRYVHVYILIGKSPFVQDGVPFFLTGLL